MFADFFAEYLKKMLIENKNEKLIEKELKEKYPNLYLKNDKESSKKVETNHK